MVIICRDALTVLNCVMWFSWTDEVPGKVMTFIDRGASRRE